MNTFLSFIVKDSRYYNIPKENLAYLLGTLTFIAELFLIPSHLLLGSLMDSVGRKWPTAIGLFISGFCMMMIPLGRSIYPTLCILRVLIALGILCSQNSPLLADYIQKPSQGLANSYSNIVITFSIILSTTGMI